MAVSEVLGKPKLSPTWPRRHKALTILFTIDIDFAYYTTYIFIKSYIYTPRIQSMDYLHAFGYARSQSVRPCYLRSDHDFCMHVRQFIFRLISDKFRQSMGNSR